MGKQSVSSKSETNQEVDYKEIAWEIISDCVFEMNVPLSKLRAINELVHGYASGNEDFPTEAFNGLTSILSEIVYDWRELIDKAHEIFPDPRTPSAGEVQS
jgi:hypothetical protein